MTKQVIITLSDDYEWRIDKQIEKLKLEYKVTKVKGTKKYPEYILRCVRQNLGYEADDKRVDKEIKLMDRSEVFERYLEWQGMIGYADELLRVIEYIYDIDLED